MTKRLRLHLLRLVWGILLAVGQPVAAEIAIDPAQQGVAEAAFGDADLAGFYRDRGFAPVWTGQGEVFAARRHALFQAMARAPLHGLPAARHDPDMLRATLTEARHGRDIGRAEIAFARAFLDLARDLSTGVLTPGEVDPAIKRAAGRPEAGALLKDFAASDPSAFLRGLAPSSREYVHLLKAHLALVEVERSGGWGPPIAEGRLELGDTGPAVVALRNRLIALGYLPRRVTATYDDAIVRAVEAFQARHGLTVDGIVGESTRLALNVPPEDRRAQVLVALERERWLTRERGGRHVWVNLPDFSAAIVDRGAVTFRTHSVIGKDTADRQSPEFSDVMDHMVINPSWYVPRSIVTKEYLPKLRRNRWAVGHIEVTDSRGRAVNRNNVNFAQFTERTFPYSMRQPPGSQNALGQVKFMFPNVYNIYLHDTPAKSLFGEEVRAFSHGCIRLAEPGRFAHTLLAPQTDDPVAFFETTRASGRETRVELDTPIPVHIVYRTAFTDDRGRLNFRRDVYGRDARIAAALAAAGVAIGRPGS